MRPFQALNIFTQKESIGPFLELKKVKKTGNL